MLPAPRSEPVARKEWARAGCRWRACSSDIGLHAHDQVEQLLALNDLRGRLAADSGLDHAFDVGDIDAITRDFLAVHVDLHAGLASSRTTVSSVKPGTCWSTRLISTRFVFEHLQVVTEIFTASALFSPVSASSTASSAGCVKLKITPG